MLGKVPAVAVMLNAAFTHQFVISCLVGLLVWAAISDYRTFTIPNRVSLCILILYPAHVMSYPAPVFWTASLAMAAVVFAVGCLLFAMKAMGGGDVKLLAVTTLWAGPAYIFEYFVVTGTAGLILAIVFAARTALADGATAEHRTFLGAVADIRHVPIMKLTIPYGVAISAAGLFVSLRLLGT